MNGLQCRRWLEAAAACDPAGGYAGPAALIAALPAATWEGAVRGGEGATLRLLARPGALGSAQRRATAAALGLAPERLSGAPAVDAPWLDAGWDGSRRAWTRVELGVRCVRGQSLRALRPENGPERRLQVKAFRPAEFEEPTASALAAFAALAPVRRVLSVAGREGWTLELRRPLPWPLFLRCDLSAAFSARAAQLSLLLRDLAVRALDFDGEALWARFGG